VETTTTPRFSRAVRGNYSGAEMRKIVLSANENPAISVKLTPRDRKALAEMGDASVTALLYHWYCHEEERRRFNYREIARLVKPRKQAAVMRDAITSFLKRLKIGAGVIEPENSCAGAGLVSFIVEPPESTVLPALRRMLLDTPKLLERLRGFEKVGEKPTQVTLSPLHYLQLQTLGHWLDLGPSELGRLIVQDKILFFTVEQEERRRRSA